MKVSKHIDMLNSTLDNKENIGSQLLVVLLLEDLQNHTPTICLTAAIGASRAVLSSCRGTKLYSLNSEHSIPGSSTEEERVLGGITKKVGI